MAEAGESHRAFRVALALAVVPLAVAAVHLLVGVGGDYYPNGDVAQTEMLVRDVGRQALWLGPYSRDGWYHPGPAVYYVLAVPYRLLGSSGTALAVAALGVNAGSVLGMALLARRHGGTRAALVTLVVTSVLLRALGPEMVRLPWNVYLTVLPYGLALFLAWALVCGDRWALPAAVAVTSFVAQTHVGYVALAVPVTVAGAAVLAGRAVRAEGWRAAAGRLVRPALVATALGAVLWLPPVVHELTGETGNAGRIVAWFRDGDAPTRTLGEGWRVVASQYTLDAEWFAGAGSRTFAGEPAYVYGTVVPVLLVAVAAAAVVLWSRERAGRLLVAVWFMASAVAVVATARTVGILYAYRVDWTRVLGTVGGLLCVWAAWVVLVARWPGLDAVLARVALAAVAVLAVVSSVSAVQAGVPTAEVSRRLDGLAPEVRRELGRLPGGVGDGEVLVRSTSFGAVGFGAGLQLDLERHGIHATGIDASVGGHRHHRDGDPLRATLVVVIDQDIVAYLERDGHRLLAYDGSVPLQELVTDPDRVPVFGAAAVFLAPATSAT